MLLKLFREGLGRTIALVDQLTRPTPISRSADEQRKVDEAAKDLSVYQYYACPFCIKTRRALHRLALPIELRDAQNDSDHREALQNGGGKAQVPCLRIDGEDNASTWMYESDAIIAYLEQRFGQAEA